MWKFRARQRAQMNATPPEASYEYSRGSGLFRARNGTGADRSGAGVFVLGAGLLAALLLVVAELTALYTVHVQTSTPSVRSVATGAHDGYALIPIALLAIGLALAFHRGASRAALLALLALGIMTLLIALVGDLPDARAHGITRSFELASNQPSAGLYLESLGAVVLVLAGGGGLLLLGRPLRIRAHPKPPGLDPDTGR
jgi:hypothetical protein